MHSVFVASRRRVLLVPDHFCWSGDSQSTTLSGAGRAERGQSQEQGKRPRRRLAASLPRSADVEMPDEYILRFAAPPPAAASGDDDQVSYSLLELPPDLIELVRNASAPLELRGPLDEEAVLVTPDRTYSLRSVQNSNSVLIAQVAGSSSSDGGATELGVLKTVGETIEATDVTGVPGTRLAALEDLLDGTEYYGEDEEPGSQGPSTESLDDASAQHPSRWTKKRRVSTTAAPPPTFSALQTRLRASDAEIRLGLRRARAVSFPSKSETGEPVWRRVPASLQIRFLSSLLATLTAHDISSSAGFDRSSLVKAIEEDDDDPPLVSRAVAEQIIAWYTTDPPSLSIDAIVADLGKLILFGHATSKPVPLGTFLTEWEASLGGPASAFSSSISLSTLVSDALFSPSPYPPFPTRETPNATITPFPCSHLSSDPATRMRQLFAARTKWESGEMSPFLMDLTGGDVKKADGLVLKYCRKVKEKVPVSTERVRGKAPTETREVTWLSARNNW